MLIFLIFCFFGRIIKQIEEKKTIISLLKNDVIIDFVKRESQNQSRNNKNGTSDK